MDPVRRSIAGGLRPMRRVLVIGCGGAGKSTFAEIGQYVRHE